MKRAGLRDGPKGLELAQAFGLGSRSSFARRDGLDSRMQSHTPESNRHEELGRLKLYH